MAKIEDLIAQIPDERLRKGIAAEVKALKKTKKFGLVFEEHLPETVRLPNLTVKPGELVAVKSESGNRLWRVKSIEKKIAVCDAAVEGYPSHKETNKEFPVSDLVVVRSFGEPIYPALVPVDRVERGGPDKPWHLLINADNFHALQLLLYCYEGQVDVIYIDPPYNTGARDWKYNNDYVDATDAWRHSKWLSMMKKRLTLAKRLLKPDGVLIITIDDNELHRLRSLIDELFAHDAVQLVTIVINPKGVVTKDRFPRVQEFGIYVFEPGASLEGRADDYLTPEPDEGYEAASGRRPRWNSLLRSGTEATREDRENMFYPVLINSARGKVVGAGEPLPLNENPDLAKKVEGHEAVWPVRRDGSWGRWGVGNTTLRGLIESGYVALGEYDKKRKTWGISYLSQQHREQLAAGMLEQVGCDKNKNVIDVRYPEKAVTRIKSVWKRVRHDAGAYGSDLLRKFVGEDAAFQFPKSLYAVEDALLPIVRNRKNALILDFFAGSGTTFHATALMNWRDGGCRKSIIVTNNEVNETLSAELAKRGMFLGDEEYEKRGVALSVTWPRCKAAVLGKRADGKHLSGLYFGSNAQGKTLDFKDGFKENIEFFQLDFRDPSEVARGDAFAAILPILWLMAGCQGSREDSKGSQPWFIPKNSPFAVLIREKEFRAFREKLAERKDIKWIFLVTDSEENFGLMRRALGRKFECVQLYKSYLENFRLNTPEALGQGGAA